MATIIAQLEWHATQSVWYLSATEGRARGQTFTMPYTADVSQIQLYMKRKDNGWSTSYRLALKEGVPGAGGALVAALNFDSSELPTVLSWVSFDFTSVELTEGGVYHWSMASRNAVGTSIIETPIIELAQHRGGIGGDIYAGGKAYRATYLTGEWTIDGDGSHDFAFIVGTTPTVPTLVYPENGLTNVYLNENWLQNFLWEDADSYPLSAYTVWFWRPSTGWVEQTDRSRYSIIIYKLNLKGTHEYNTTYYWFVRKDLGGEAYVDSDTWSFTTMIFAPPIYSTREREPYGGGDPITVPTGENNQLTVRRLIVAAKNKIYYEGV